MLEILDRRTKHVVDQSGVTLGSFAALCLNQSETDKKWASD